MFRKFGCGGRGAVNRARLSRLAVSRMRSSAGDTLSQLCVWHLLPRTALPLAPPLPSIASAGAALFGGTHRYYGRVRLPGRTSSDYGCGPLPMRTAQDGLSRPASRGSPVPLQAASTRARGLRPRRTGLVLAIAPHPVLPSAYLYSVGTLNGKLFAAQYSARVFLSTLRRHPCGCRRNSGSS